MLVSGLVLISVAGCKNQQTSGNDNPFFSEYNTPYNVPPFDKIRAKDYMPAFEKGMDEGRIDIGKIVNDKSEPTFKNTIEAFDRAGELLGNVSKVFFSQSSANTNDSLQKIEIDISPILSAYQDEILLNKGLFERIKSVYDNQEKFDLNPEQKFILEKLYKSFVRNGANLNQQDQDTLKALNQKLSVLTVRFSQNVLAETNNYLMYVIKRISRAFRKLSSQVQHATQKKQDRKENGHLQHKDPASSPFCSIHQTEIFVNNI